MRHDPYLLYTAITVIVITLVLQWSGKINIDWDFASLAIGVCSGIIVMNMSNDTNDGLNPNKRKKRTKGENRPYRRN